ncbi:MAG: hypothetical protein P1P80_10035 [ANME-2 cluster archaeon]|nr:hypothetical protein [ANME-2 cluster archaeon]
MHVPDCPDMNVRAGCEGLHTDIQEMIFATNRPPIRYITSDSAAHDRINPKGRFINKINVRVKGTPVMMNISNPYSNPFLMIVVPGTDPFMKE